VHRDCKGSGRIGEKRAELADAILQLQLLEAACASFERDLDRAFKWPTDKPVKPNQAEKFNRLSQPTKYNRAPATWKGRRGYDLVSGILKVQARDKCSVAAAVRKLRKSEPKEWPEKERDLQRRYQEIKDYWGPWCRIEMMLEAEAAALLAKTESLATKVPKRK
jgi:hypothetical protein